jgi:hypothetical protein
MGISIAGRPAATRHDQGHTPIVRKAHGTRDDVDHDPASL